MDAFFSVNIYRHVLSGHNIKCLVFLKVAIQTDVDFFFSFLAQIDLFMYVCIFYLFILIRSALALP